MIKSLNELLELKGNKMKLAVVACQDEDVLGAVVESAEMGISDPILIGSKQETFDLAEKLGLDISTFRFIESSSLEEAAETGVRLVSAGEADYLMKGLVDTSILLKAVLNKEWGLRTDSLLSHVMVYEIGTYHKLLYLTDGGMNLYPDVEEKAKIIDNASAVARAMGNEKIKVAVLAAKEKVNPKMQATVDAAELERLGKEGRFGDDVIVEGPMALDLALSKEAVQVKRFPGEVAGDADILLVPNIEMGNGIGKAITYLAGGKSAGIIMGAKVPVVLVSRADDKETKLYSIALGNMIAKYSREMAK
ncbi:bifunctional enoyl-CoA hydratase/phosphate acetyltransferase [Gudongella oleilytica]|uniref:bifunctional enoyl-CoA hydratase/phosphate acetyltransferase n=1 Tax=Gudongella oleilytica TaxID=1582259 RepID=UPI002A3675E9|nr:bifunctional enoyl-CoA hydratase/phosphate acetyltransferase [Gudongella oleilytica]MDY0257502.1 bifunctional enoyl-CoA hydratase/phosphate acetyltransferase [Gudongella oleilytica]